MKCYYCKKKGTYEVQIDGEEVRLCGKHFDNYIFEEAMEEEDD